MSLYVRMVERRIGLRMDVGESLVAQGCCAGSAPFCELF